MGEPINGSNNQWLFEMYQLVLNKEDILLHYIVFTAHSVPDTHFTYQYTLSMQPLK